MRIKLSETSAVRPAAWGRTPFNYTPEYAQYYDRIQEAQGVNYDAMANSIDKILKYDETPVKKILEICVSTGELAKRLLEKGYQVEAIETSPALLDIAEKKLGKDINLYEGDLMDLDEKYDAVYTRGGLWWVTPFDMDEPQSWRWQDYTSSGSSPVCRGKLGFDTRYDRFYAQEVRHALYRIIRQTGMILTEVQPVRKSVELNLGEGLKYMKKVDMHFPMYTETDRVLKDDEEIASYYEYVRRLTQLEYIEYFYNEDVTPYPADDVTEMSDEPMGEEAKFWVQMTDQFTSEDGMFGYLVDTSDED